MGLLSPMVYSVLFFVELPFCFPHGPHCFTFPPARLEGFHFLQDLTSTCYFLGFFFFLFFVFFFFPFNLYRPRRQHFVPCLSAYPLQPWLLQGCHSVMWWRGGQRGEAVPGALPLSHLLSSYPHLHPRPCAYFRPASSALALQQSSWEGGWLSARPTWASRAGDVQFPLALLSL